MPVGSVSRMRSIVAPSGLPDGSPVGIAWIMLHPPAPADGAMTRAIPGSPVSFAATAQGLVVAGVTICSVPGAPVPKACWTWS